MVLSMAKLTPFAVFTPWPQENNFMNLVGALTWALDQEITQVDWLHSPASCSNGKTYISPNQYCMSNSSPVLRHPQPWDIQEFTKLLMPG